jgi:uncharacterized RDD family membrane protein YckC
MSEIEQYLSEVARHIQATAEERQRIEADLRAHLEEAVRAGEPPGEAIARMGTPVEVAAEFMARRPLLYAGFLLRLAAFAVDMAAIFVTVALAAGTAEVGAGLVWREPPIELAYAVGALIMGFILLYFPLLEGRYGQTAGKHLLGLRVLKESGLPIGYKEALLRRVSFYLYQLLLVDVPSVLFTARRQRLLDLLMHTVVVREAR